MEMKVITVPYIFMLNRQDQKLVSLLSSTPCRDCELLEVTALSPQWSTVPDM